MEHKKTILDDIKKLFCIWILAFAFLLISIAYICIREKGYYLLPAVGLPASCLALYWGYVHVYRNYKKIEQLCQLYIEGYISDDEFEKSVKISEMIDKVYRCKDERSDKIKILNLSKKQAQYLALQNQINPHFLYNTLEGIRSEAICAGVESVANMSEALATFFRYTISNIDKMVTFEDELANIENYYNIQRYRFGKKLQMEIDYGEDLSILNIQLPKLILQPIVENAVYHGIEHKLGQGILKIKAEYTEKRMVIKVMDNGMGMDEKKLEELNSKLLTNSLDDIDESGQKKKGGIAILNVNNRIKLLYGEEYGVFIQSTKNVGTDVEITLPVIRE